MSKGGNERNHWIGFDLGGTKMLAVALDAKMQPVGRKRKRTDGHQGAQAGLERIAQTIVGALDEAGIAPDRLAGIGVGCPGPLDLDRGVIVEAPNLGWRDVAIESFLETKFGCPARICNDVDAGVYGEYRFGAARGSRCVVGVFPGTGVGGGCVYEGKILRGRRGSVMEIGHVRVLPEGPMCGCGLRGCLEAVASRLAISAAAAQAAFRGQAPSLLTEIGTDIANIRSGALANSVAAGDEAVVQIIRNATDAIGVAVAGAIHLLGPDTIVLGGGLVEAMPGLFVNGVRESAARNVMPAFRDTFEVFPAELGDDAAVMGAAAWVQVACGEGEDAQRETTSTTGTA
ncbi:MAG: ROK family protein [Pirellulales bacterium]